MDADLLDKTEHLDRLFAQNESTDDGEGNRTIVGVNGTEENPEGFLAFRKKKPLDSASPAVRNAFKGLRSVAPGASVAGLGALIGGLPSGGIGVPLGIAAALGSKAIYDMGSGLVVNPLSQLFRGKDLLPSSNILMDKAMDKLGVPYPETEAEQSLFNIGRAGIDAFGGGPALGKIFAELPSAGPVMKAVGTEMQVAPKMQIAGGMSGQAAVDTLDPNGEYPFLDLPVAMLGGMIPFAARATPNALWGKRQITPAHQAAMRQALENRALSVSNSEIQMTPQDVNSFVKDASASNALSAGVRGLFREGKFFEPMQNRLAVMNAEKNILGQALNPSEAVNNINRSQTENLEQIPGFTLGSAAAANDEGVAAALSSANGNPRVIQRANLNQGALSQYATDIAAPNPAATPGAFEQAAEQRRGMSVQPAERALVDADTQILRQQQMLDSIQAAREAAEQELKRIQMQIAENGSVAQRAASGEVGNTEFWRKNKAVDAAMEATKNPAELIKPISIDPLLEGLQQSKQASSMALEGANPEILIKEEQLKRFGAPLAPTASGPVVSKTVIAAEPAAMGPASAMTPERAAQIEAGIKAIPAPKGPSKYLEDLGGPVESTIKTPSGQMVKVRRKLVELEDIVRGGKSEAHPAEYQNRDRSTAASQNQVNEIVGKFNPPEITGSNPVATSGAPIVGPQGNVLEGGHARMSALERVLTEPGSAAQREAYLAELKKGGHDVTGFKNPVEVQERVTPMAPQEVQGFVQDLNRPSVSALSTSDMARGDASALGKSLGKLDPTKPLDHPSNAEFVRSMNSTQLGSTEYASFLKPDGTPNTALVKRYNDALSQAAYGGKSKAADTLLRSLRDDSDTMVKTIASAMEDSAGGFAKLRSAIESGQIPPEYDLGTKVADAASFVREARRQGTHPMEMLKTNDMFGGLDDQTKAIVELFYNEGSNRQQGTKALGQTLNKMAAEAMQQDTGLGLGSGATPDQIIQRGKQAINAKVGMTEVAPEASMAKQTEAAPAMSKTEAVAVASAPPEQFTVEHAMSALESLTDLQREAKRIGDHKAVRAYQAPIDKLKDQLNTAAPDISEGKRVYKEDIAPIMAHGIASDIKRAGRGGDPHNVHPSRFLDQWLAGEPSTKEAAQLAALMGDTPDNIDAVRQWSISHLASDVRESATGEGIRAWVKQRDNVFNQKPFADIRDELLQHANQLDSHVATKNQAGKDLEIERQRLGELRTSRSAAESNLSAQKATSEKAGSMRVARGEIDSVLKDPKMAAEAVSAASTPAARADLDNQVRAYIDGRLKNKGVNADRPIGLGAPTVDDLNVSMAKTVRDLLEGKGRQSLETLTSPDHVKRLEMLANGLESEAKPSKLTRGSVQGSPTQQYSAVERAVKASSPFYRRVTTQVLEVLTNTGMARQFMADIALNKELLKQILLMHKANDPSAIKGWAKAFAKNSGQIASSAGQFDSGWRKREQSNEESGEAPGASDEKE